MSKDEWEPFRAVFELSLDRLIGMLIEAKQDLDNGNDLAAIGSARGRTTPMARYHLRSHGSRAGLPMFYNNGARDFTAMKITAQAAVLHHVENSRTGGVKAIHNW
jgi:hypothetical protein